MEATPKAPGSGAPERPGANPPKAGLGVKLLALAMGATFAVGLVEILPRVAPGLMPAKVRSVVRLYEARDTWAEMMRGDSELGYTLRPGLELDFPSEGRSVHVRTVDSGIDGVGMRDIGTTGPYGTIVVGDSFSFCDDAPVEECWVKHLAEDTGMSVATLGVNGYSNLAAARLLDKAVQTMKPKVVLAGFFPNDFKDNLHFRNWTKSGTDDYWTWMRRKRRSDTSEFLARTSVLYRLIDAARRYGDRDVHRYEADGLRFTFRSDAWWRTVVNEVGETPGFLLTKDALKQMQATADSIDAQLIVLLFPFKEQVYWHIAEKYQPEGQAFTQADIDAPVGALLDFCEDAGIRCCDLTEPMRAHAERGEQLYLSVSAHWNAQGNRVAADAVRACMTAEGLVDRRGLQTARLQATTG